MRRSRRVVLALLGVVMIGSAIAGSALAHHRGYRAYIVHTGSMDGTYNSGDLVVDEPFSGSLHVGEVITFLHSGLSNDVVTHRIVSLNNGTIQTKGDANPTKDAWNIRYDQVKGVVVTSVPKGGFVVYFFKQPAGDGAAMTGLLALILLYGLFFGSSADVKNPAGRAEDSGGDTATDLDNLPPFAQAIERLRRGEALGTLTTAHTAL